MKYTQWHTVDQLPASAWSAIERTWLPYSGSLTEALDSATEHQAQLVILRESQETPQTEERIALKLPSDTKAYVREGGWYYQDTLWIATRVVIPVSLLNKPGSPLKDLGQRPIGKVLFTNPNTTRYPFEFKTVTREDSGKDKSSITWARRSLFSFEGELLLVNEIFLPTFFTKAPALP